MPVPVMRAIMVGSVLLTLCVAPATAQTFAETKQQVRRDCRVDALRYCPKEAARCLMREDKPCTDAIIACMAINKAKLQPTCARWMW